VETHSSSSSQPPSSSQSSGHFAAGLQVFEPSQLTSHAQDSSQSMPPRHELLPSQSMSQGPWPQRSRPPQLARPAHSMMHEDESLQSTPPAQVSLALHLTRQGMPAGQTTVLWHWPALQVTTQPSCGVQVPGQPSQGSGATGALSGAPASGWAGPPS
jgi:hypothetical protein